MAAETTERERELVLADNEQALIQDTTKGHVTVYVGPYKASLSETDRPVRFDPGTGKFIICKLEESKRLLTEADEGSYVVLENPTEKNNSKLPEKGNNGSVSTMEVGRKINIPGPIRFPLWPGQYAVTIPGHNLRTNQYLIAKVYNDKAAEENWDKTVIKVQDDDPKRIKSASLEKPDNLSIGKLFIVPGTKVSFYIPPTGIEVIPDENGNFVRDAVTLERLEYCVLLDESGDKRYVSGPKVVFPEPTEVFIEEDGENVFRAIELNHLMGLYVKVIAPYTDGSKSYEVGDELFIKGERIDKTTIYFPRQEHAIIKYGNQKIHYAITIPDGEARYVLNRETGEIKLVHGPKMFLPDPRSEVVVKRVIDPKMVELLYPENKEALEYNKKLVETVRGTANQYVTKEEFDNTFAGYAQTADFAAVCVEAPAARSLRIAKAVTKASSTAVSDFVGDDFNRKQKYTPPRTLTLDTKYDGAVTVNIWNGYAVMVIDKKGNRRVEIGPKTILLEYDESVEVMELSTGKPKTTDKLLKTAYLRVLNNKISDIIVDSETKDLCPVRLYLSYRVNFEGEDHKRWFDVENYVKFLCDHVRSLVKNEIKKHDIRDFHDNAADIIRDLILGKTESGHNRLGRLFPENNMRIYDVEVLRVEIGDPSISTLLTDEQRNAVKQILAIEALRRELELTKQQESVKNEINQVKNDSLVKTLELQQVEIERKKAVELVNVQAQAEIKMTSARAQADVEMTAAKNRAEIDMTNAKSQAEVKTFNSQTQVELQEALTVISEKELSRKVAEEKEKTNIEKERNENELKCLVEKIKAETESVKDKVTSVSPELIAALQAFGDKDLLARTAESLAPLAIIQKAGIMEVLGKALEGTPFAQVAAGTIAGNKMFERGNASVKSVK